MTKLSDPLALDAFREASERYGLTPPKASTPPLPEMPNLSMAEWMVVHGLLQRGLTTASVADKTGLTVAEVQHVEMMARDSTEAAKQFLRASALPIAQRVVNEADVDQGLELLDRLDVAPR